MEPGHNLFNFVTEALNCKSDSVEYTEHNAPEVLRDFHIPFSVTTSIEELTVLVSKYFLIEEPTLKFVEGDMAKGLLRYSESVDGKNRLIPVSINRIVGRPMIHITVIDFNKTQKNIRAGF